MLMFRMNVSMAKLIAVALHLLPVMFLCRNGSNSFAINLYNFTNINHIMFMAVLLLQQ